MSKYYNYTTSDDKDVRLANKLAERIVQIYEFFKMKSNNQNLLSLIQQKIEAEINRITSQSPLNLGELLTYIHLITKERCIIKVAN